MAGVTNLAKVQNAWNCTSTPSLIVLVLKGQQRCVKILQSDEWRVEGIRINEKWRGKDRRGGIKNENERGKN